MDRRKFIKAAGILAGTTILDRHLYGEEYLTKGSNPGKRPNILLIMTDQQSASAMSCIAGKKYLSTPVLDELASRGTIFTNAYSANPLCVPCRTSIFTGFYPHQTGVETNSNINTPLAGRFKHMGTIFSEAGYDTGYIGKWHMAFPAKDTASHGFGFMRSIKNNGVDNEIPSGADEFLRMRRDKPFLLVTSFVNPHNICEWPRGEKLPDGEVGKPASEEECPPLVSNYSPMENEPEILPMIKKSYQSSRLFPVGNFDEKKWREYRWAYYRLIEKVDALIGKVIQSLKDSGQYDNTVIMFTSDHGDNQGAHGWSQKTVLFEESVKVPLVISEPGKRIGSKRTFLVNTGVDILPTLCGYARISLAEKYPGIDLKNSGRRREYITVENKMVQGESIDGYKPEPGGRMIRSQKYKYCLYDIGEQNESLVDLEKDPGEMHNLARKKEYEEVLRQHRNYLLEWRKKNGDQFPVKYQKIN